MFNCNVLAHSVSPVGKECLTFLITFPRNILAEMNTHRMLSKNSASSRAIPFDRPEEVRVKAIQEGKRLSPCMIDMIMDDPYIPIHWGANGKGMQEGTELSEAEIAVCRSEWLEARNDAIRHAKNLWAYGLHKEHCNRIVEPWAWMTQVVTGTDWDNFFALRTDKAASRPMQKIARMMYLARRKSVPQKLDYGEWHLPFILTSEQDQYAIGQLKIMSVARCCRTSYLTHEGVKSLEDDLKTYDKLVGAWPKHMSPFEHQAMPALPQYLESRRAHSNLKGWFQFRKEFDQENITIFEPSEEEILAWDLGI